MSFMSHLLVIYYILSSHIHFSHQKKLMAFLTNQFAFYFLLTIFSIISLSIGDYQINVANQTPSILTTECFLDDTYLGKNTFNSMETYRFNVTIVDGNKKTLFGVQCG